MKKRMGSRIRYWKKKTRTMVTNIVLNLWGSCMNPEKIETRTKHTITTHVVTPKHVKSFRLILERFILTGVL